jgi:uncharacterized protein (TIGR02246 family)
VGRSANQLVSGAILLFLIAGTNSRAQNKAVEEQAVRKLPQAFCDAWNKHDGHELAKLMAEDVDFVTVGALWLHGRTNFEKYHARLLSGRFKDATVATLQASVRFLRPDVAAVHWSWTIRGDRNIDGTPRFRRFGMMTMVAEKRAGHWQVIVAQNDNADLTPVPELGNDVAPVVPIPGTNYKQQGLRLRPRHDFQAGVGKSTAVIPSEAKDLQFRTEANKCRFFASLRMTDIERAKEDLLCHRSRLQTGLET